MPRLQRNRKQQKWRTPILIVAECELNNVAERLDRRNEVINEGKKRSDDTAAAMREPEPASAAHDLRESSLEPDPNPKRRLLMKSASSTASGSGERSAKKPAADSESGMQTGAPLELGTGESTALPGASSANTRRRIVVKSEPAAVTDQDAVDGYREKRNEDRECRTSRTGQHHGAVNHGSCAQMGKTIEPLWETVAEQSRWLEPEESQSLDSCLAPA